MLNVRFVVTEINYEQTFVNVYPALYKKLNTVQSQNIAVQLLKKLGMDAQEIAVELMTMLDQANRDRLLIYLLESYKEQWLRVIKEYLLANKYGKNFRIEDIQLCQDVSGQLILNVKNIKIDYKGLLHCGLMKTGGVHGFVGVGIELLPESAMEQFALTILQNDEIKGKLIEVVETAVIKYGLCLRLGSAQVQKVEAWEKDVFDMENTLPDDMGDALLDVVAAYLKKSVRKE